MWWNPSLASSNLTASLLVIVLLLLKPMATAAHISAAQSAAAGAPPPALAAQAQTPADGALVPAQAGPAELAVQATTSELDAETMDPIVARIPIELDIAIPLPNFRVRNLLALAPGAVLESEWDNGSDLPLRAGHVTLAWAEFEVMDTTLAVRITRLA